MGRKDCQLWENACDSWIRGNGGGGGEQHGEANRETEVIRVKTRSKEREEMGRCQSKRTNTMTWAASV